MPIPAWRACRSTVASSQASAEFAGFSITRARVPILAMVLDMSREMMAPPKPKMAQKISSPVRLWPCPLRY